MITLIPIEQLRHHPSNPRKNIGDVTELAESIKEQGILQNLTVVKAEDETFNVVIGNRRLEGSLLAGLKELPCVISDMDEKTQLSTMLVENMQRSDLTPIEEAQGIQQCLDFGMTDDEIAKKTGFSKSTIRNRKQLLLLDKERVNNASNATMEDYINLERIEDLEVRNNLLDLVGSNEFKIEVEQAYQDQEEEKRKLKIIEKLVELNITEATSTPYQTHRYVVRLWAGDEEEYEESIEYLSNQLSADKTYVYENNNYLSLYSLKEAETVDEAELEEEREQKRKVRQARMSLKKLFTSAYAVRYEFIKTFLKGKVEEKQSKLIIEYLVQNSLIGCQSFTPKSVKLNELLGYTAVEREEGKKYYEPEVLTSRASKESRGARAVNLLLASIYLTIDREDRNTYNTDGEYSKHSGESMSELYDFLKGFGYQVSELEQSLIDGTNENYLTPKKGA